MWKLISIVSIAIFAGCSSLDNTEGLLINELEEERLRTQTQFVKSLNSLKADIEKIESYRNEPAPELNELLQILSDQNKKKHELLKVINSKQHSDELIALLKEFKQKALGTQYKYLQDPLDERLTTELEILKKSINNIPMNIQKQVIANRLERWNIEILEKVLSNWTIDPPCE